MSDGPQKPVTNEEIMAALDNLQERLETLVDLTQQAIREVREASPARGKPATTTAPYLCVMSCGCHHAIYRCPAHVGIVNMTHPERP